jgi:hypothetical protein
MTQDQRNAFVKLVEQVKGEYRERHSVPYEERERQEAELRKKFEAKHHLAPLRKRYDQAAEAKRAAESRVEEVESKVGREISAAAQAEHRRFEVELGVFTSSTARVLALDDAKEAQKVIEGLIAR